MYEDQISIKILGARGSLPVSKDGYNVFGGATSCFKIEADGQELILDGGSGLVSDVVSSTHSYIFISHFHIDHLIGLPGYAGLSMPDHRTDIYTPAFLGWSGCESLRRLYTPPYWPLGLEDYPGDVRIDDCSPRMEAGCFTVETAVGRHPDGCLIYRISAFGKTIIYATDYEHDGKGDRVLCELAEGADVLIYDGTYSDEEYNRYKGFGHSTPNEGIRIARQAGIKKLIITHHATDHDDEFLSGLESDLKKGFKGIVFARQGEIISI